MIKQEKYINPFTDYGFKRIFGEESNKNLLLDFLNELLKDQEEKIIKISYLPNKQLPIYTGNRKSIFDIYCTNEKGKPFIVEMQKAEHEIFFDSTIFNPIFFLQKKVQYLNIEYKTIYSITFLDFCYKNLKSENYLYKVKLIEQQTKQIFDSTLTYIYLDMTKFNKTEKAIKTRFEKWMFILKNLPKFDRKPVELKDKIFLKLFEIAEIAKLKPDEYKQYEKSLYDYRDILNTKNAAYAKQIKN